MSLINLVPGANRVIKLTPNSSVLQDLSTDNIFDMSLLSETKFNNWNLTANLPSKISIVKNNDDEISRFIDTNYNVSLHKGTIWFSGSLGQDDCYYLQTGDLEKINDPSVFEDTIMSFGFHENGNSIDRCGQKTIIGSNVTYVQEGLVGEAYGFLQPDYINSALVTPEVVECRNLSKLTISLLIREDEFSEYTIFLNNHTQDFLTYGIYIDKYAGIFDITFFDMSVCMVMANASTSLGEPYLLTIVFDGTKENEDIDLQNKERFKVYINDVEVTDLSFFGNVPDVTWAGQENSQFEIGTDGYTFKGTIDELKIVPLAWSDEEITRRYNQIFNKTTYWIPTVQPVILSVEKYGSKQWKINGTGFKPESVNPTGTINGKPFIIMEEVTDTTIIVKPSEDLVTKKAIFSVTNSDNEADMSTVLVPKIPFNPNFPGTSFCGITIAGFKNICLILPKIKYFFRIPNIRR